MAFIPELAGEVSGNEMVGRNMMILLPRSIPDPSSSSADEFSALTDVPLFLGYMLSYILTGIMLVQVFLYYLYFRRKDPRFMKLTVLALFLVECISSVIATVIVIYSIIARGYLSYSILVPAFQALAILSGVATSMVHGFYCWRVHVLGGHWSMIVVIMGISFAQCIMVSLISSGTLEGGDVLGSGTVSTTQPGYLSFNVIWLGGSAVCDIMIATSILYLQNRIMKSLGKTSPLASRVERMMSVTIDTGMVTAIGAGIELLLYLILRNSLVHFTLFYPLPKLYANCLMATLNARLATPDQGFRETTFITAELSDSEAADGYFKGPPNRQSLPTSIQIKVQEATTYRSSVSSSVIDIKRRSTSFSNESYPVLSFNAVATKRSSILDLKNVEPHYHDRDHSVHHVKLSMPQQQESHPPEFQFRPLPIEEASSHPPPAADSNIPLNPGNPGFVLPAIARHSVMRVGLFQSRRSVRKSVDKPHVHDPERGVKEDTSFRPIPGHPADNSNLLMPWEDSMEFAVPTENQTAPSSPLVVQPTPVELETRVFPAHLEPLRAPEATLQSSPF